LTDKFLSKTPRERESRIARLLDKFYHIENYPFFSKKEAQTCPICKARKGNEKICQSLEELSKHIMKYHKDEDADLIIFAQEGIMQVLLKKKISYEHNRSKFSN